MKQESEKYRVKQVLSNNLFLLKQIGKVSPWRIPLVLTDAMADWSKGLIFRVFVVGYVLNQIQSAASLRRIFVVVGLLALLSFACHLVNILLKNCFFPRSDLKIQSYFMKLAFDKAREVDLECYEDGEYFERHIRAINALKSRPRMVLDSIEMLFGALFGFLALSGLALSLDGFMILFIALQIVANFVFARKENYERRAYEVELAESNRQADYIRRVHYMPEYAKELRTTNISDVLFKRFITATQNGIRVIKKHGIKCAVYRLFVDAVCTRMGYYLVILFAVFRILVLRNMMIGDGLMVAMAMFSVTEALLDQVSSFPYGPDTMMTREFDEEGVSLSGGQAQKIALSRLYAKDAPIAILDEPSSALDPIAEYELFENMKRICEGRTVIFISHRLSGAVSADVIFMMEHGRIIERGNHESLMRQNGKYAEMFKKQAEKYGRKLPND